MQLHPVCLPCVSVAVHLTRIVSQRRGDEHPVSSFHHSFAFNILPMVTAGFDFWPGLGAVSHQAKGVSADCVLSRYERIKGLIIVVIQAFDIAPIFKFAFVCPDLGQFMPIEKGGRRRRL